MQWSQVQRCSPHTIYMINSTPINKSCKFENLKPVKMLDTPANMNNITLNFKYNDFNDFAIGMPPVAWQLVVTVIY